MVLASLVKRFLTCLALTFLRLALAVSANVAALVPPLNRKYKIRQRLRGPWCSAGSTRLWLHGASLGECKMLLSLARALKNDWPLRTGRPCPEILLTTQKAEALGVLRKSAEGVCEVTVAPADLPLTLRHFLSEVKPGALVLGENELWPGFVKSMNRFCGKQAVALVSGRVRRAAPGVRLDDLGFVTMQANGGNWKLLDWARGGCGNGCEVAGGEPRIDVAFVSFHKDEVLAFGRLASAAVTAGKSVVLVPRRLEEAELFREYLLSKKILALDWPAVQKGAVSLVGQFGLVPEILRSCNCAVVGGSFVERPGIHDFWEPLRAGVKTFVGPWARGAEEAVSALVARGAVARVSGVEESDWWNRVPDSSATRACLLEEREKILNSYERLLKFLLATV